MATIEDNVISVKNVTKSFLLPHEKTASIKTTVVHAFKKKNRDVEIQRALKGISFDIKRGEFFGILGRNGSGKSTLLKILAEIYRPSSGKVSVKGKLVPFIELGVGFNPELTGRENVYLNGALLGFSKGEIDGRYKSIVEFAELEEFMDQKLKNYSSGMQVRLAFSVATHAEADILLVDEVLAVGDADFQRKCYDYFKSLKKSNMTVVFVTHDMGAVRDYCDRALLIDEGRVAHIGNADKVADEYLQLFNGPDQATDEIEGAEELGKSRFGNGNARVRSVKVRKSDSHISILEEVENVVGENNLIVALRIHDGDGQLLTGGNTKMFLSTQEQQAMHFTPGQKKTIVYKIPRDLFGGGTYYIGSSIKLDDRVTVCDDVIDISKFSIVSEQSYFKLVTPAEVEVKE